MPQTVRLTVEYDGSNYAGWQRQAGLYTVQGQLEAALVAITGEDVASLRLACAGRTDAGVHAMGQLCSFVTDNTRPARRFAPALNHLLPLDIRVHLAEQTQHDFDVRRASEAKWYSYLVYTGAHPSALLRRRAWHLRRRLSLTAMQKGAQQLQGEHDFESFRSAHCEAAHARRRLFAVRLTAADTVPFGETLVVDLYGNAFCRHMCRILVGTLVEVGYGVRPPEDVARVLAARDRRAAGITAPPQGLTLRRVYLPGDGVPRPWVA